MATDTMDKLQLLCFASMDIPTPHIQMQNPGAQEIRLDHRQVMIIVNLGNENKASLAGVSSALRLVDGCEQIPLMTVASLLETWKRKVEVLYLAFSAIAGFEVEMKACAPSDLHLYQEELIKHKAFFVALYQGICLPLSFSGEEISKMVNWGLLLAREASWKFREEAARKVLEDHFTKYTSSQQARQQNSVKRPKPTPISSPSPPVAPNNHLAHVMDQVSEGIKAYMYLCLRPGSPVPPKSRIAMHESLCNLIQGGVRVALEILENCESQGKERCAHLSFIESKLRLAVEALENVDELDLRISPKASDPLGMSCRKNSEDLPLSPQIERILRAIEMSNDPDAEKNPLKVAFLALVEREVKTDTKIQEAMKEFLKRES